MHNSHAKGPGTLEYEILFKFEGVVILGTNYEKAFYRDYKQLYQRNEKLAGELRSLQYNYNLLSGRYAISEKKKQELAEENATKDVLIINLTKEVERLKALLNIDGTNSGIPTSNTPINKEKKIRGQHGHAKKKLERFADSEVNTYVEHVPEECPECHCTDLEDTGEVIEKVHERIPTELKEENQYGVQVQATALTFINQGNVSLNKIRKMIYGFTGGEIQLSEGYLCKLQERASRNALDFCEDIRREILKQDVVSWDDTVIMINTKRACLKFYGTDKLALYKAHMHKDKAGLDVLWYQRQHVKNSIDFLLCNPYMRITEQTFYRAFCYWTELCSQAHKRKNWLLANTLRDVNDRAVCYSILETARENDLNPYTYLFFTIIYPANGLTSSLERDGGARVLSFRKNSPCKKLKISVILVLTIDYAHSFNMCS